jgi:hypothetical protein
VIAQLETAATQIRDGAYGFGNGTLPQDTQDIKKQDKIGFGAVFGVVAGMTLTGIAALGAPIGIARSGNALIRRRRRNG